MRKISQFIESGFEPRNPSSRPTVLTTMLGYANLPLQWKVNDMVFQLLYKIINDCFPVVFYELLHLYSGLSFIYQHFWPSRQHKDLHPSGNVESCYLTPTNSHPWFAFSLTTLFISLSVCFRITILIRPAFESKFQNFCSSLRLSIPHIHTIPPFAWQRCPSSLFTGCYWVRFHPLPSQLKQFFSLPLSSWNYSLRQMRHPACSISITFTYY